MRIAMFAPVPPTRSGIAAYTAALVPWLARHHRIDLFTNTLPDDRAGVPRGATAVFSAHDFVWKHARHAYDLIMYQLGNTLTTNYLWPYLTRYAGLVVIHDGNLYDARAAYYISRGDYASYRAEFVYNDPRHGGASELGIAGQLTALKTYWPMLRTPIACARTVAVHNSWLAARLREHHPGASIDVVRPGMDDPLSAETDRARVAVRAALDLSAETIVFGVFGWVTPEKRLPQIVRALAALIDAAETPAIHLLIVGSVVDHYNVRADLHAAGLAGRVTLTGYVADAEITRYLAATDVCLCLRWPTTRETSATWLRALAAGKATIISDLAHTQEIPVLRAPAVDSRSDLCVPGGGATDPVAVAVGVGDEAWSLPIAMQALARHADLRRELGAAARAYWAANFRMEHSASDYERVIAATVIRPAVPRALPPHLDDDGSRRARDLLSPFSLRPDILQRADST